MQHHPVMQEQPLLADWLCLVDLVSLGLFTPLDLKVPSFPSRPAKDNEVPCRAQSHNVVAYVLGKAPKFTAFDGDGAQKGKVSYNQWTFKVQKCLQQLSRSSIVGEHCLILMWCGG